MPEYDVVVIGAGTGGESVFWELNGAGVKVAVVEKELIGGTCAYWGCIPSKTLLRPGDIAWEAHHGFGTGQPSLDWPQIARYRNYMVRDYDDSSQVEGLKKAGIDFFRGEASISGPGMVQIDGQTLRAEHIVVATGTEASIPPIDGLKDAGYWTNREGTALKDVPSSVLVLGGGAIGCELGQMLHGYGAEVTIVEEAPQLLGHENSGAAHHLQERFKGIGIKLYLGHRATRFERKGDTRTATLDDGTRLSAEVVLVATGRRPRVDGLGLDRIGVTPTRQGIPIDERCRTAENVWAVGDVTGIAGFTHIADYQGKIVSANILGRSRSANYSDIPAVTFTDPEVASVGLTNPDKAPGGTDIVTAHIDLEQVSRTPTYGEGYKGGLCLYADRKQKVLVGAWAVGPLAGEWVQFATLAIRARVPIAVLDDTILAFPTFTRAYLEPIRTLQKELEG